MGNYIAIEFEQQTETYNLIGAYLEPEDYATARLKTVIGEIENKIKDKENIILIGDFNSIKDPIYCKTRTIQTRNLIQKHNTLLAPILNKYQLTDIWREQNTNTTEFTHISHTNATRIDQVYCSNENVPKFKVKHKILGNFDHKAIYMTPGNRIKWGNGIWKLNVKLLQHDEVKQEIRTMIQDFKTIKHQYKPLVWWDTLKTKIKNKLITIGITQKQHQQETLRKLEAELKNEEQSANSNINKIVELTSSINKIHKEKLEASQIRARIDKLQYMDKPSKYFFDLEKIRGKAKSIDEIRNNDGEILTTKEGKQQQDCIYKLLSEKKIQKSELETLGNLITTKEIKTALSQMQNNKSPGADGLGILHNILA